MKYMQKLTVFFIAIVMSLSAYGQQPTETATSHQAPTEKPNVVFFLVDDLGWKDVSYNGSDFYETPNIDQLANEGVRFNQAYATSHVCSPTRSSIMTGKYPARNNLTDWLPGRRRYAFQKLQNAQIAPELAFEELTLAEALKMAGYSTAIFGKWHLSAEAFGPGPIEHGFDVHVPTKWNMGWPRDGYYAPFNMEGLEGSKGDYLTDRLTDEALKYIEKNKDTPFFLYLSHFAVHDPIQGPPDLVEKYENKLKQMPKLKGPPYILEGNPDAKNPLTREELNTLSQDKRYQGYSVLPNRTVKIKQHQDNPHFAAMVESMDESMGRVLSKLEDLGLEENTIVIFFSDNGGMSGANFGNPNRIVTSTDNLDKRFSTSNLPLRGAKGWLYEGGIRVPMIVKWPQEGNRGTVVEEPVISTDFYPSILEMTGLQNYPGQHVDGVSFVPLLTGQNKIDRDAIYWHFPQYSNHGMQSPGGAIRSGEYKLLEYFENNSVQLFNLEQDPGELQDLSSSEPEKVKELRDMLHEWRKEVDAQMMPPNNYYIDKEYYKNFFD